MLPALAGSESSSSWSPSNEGNGAFDEIDGATEGDGEAEV
jgi:hypothetical protein